MRMRRTSFWLSLLIATVSLTGCANSIETEKLTVDSVETAGICGFRALWNTPIQTSADGLRTISDKKITDRGGAAPWDLKARENGAKPAALAIDAMHRMLLVRFPDAAQAIADKINAGYSVQKAEIVLPFEDEELWPWGTQNWAPPEGGYIYRANWGVDKLYRQRRPIWHAIAYALKKPWIADPEIGPTFNAYIAGSGFWEHFGAQDETSDRYSHQFGPTPVNFQSPKGRMDITTSLTDPAYGDTIAARLRRLSDCGFLLRKWETYDHQYFPGVYEWGTCTGGRAIVMNTPQLVITLAKDGKTPAIAELPLPVDVRSMAASLKENGNGGHPTARMPDREELKAIARKYATTRPDWMPDWQWAHVQQLLELQYGAGATEKPFWYQFLPGHVKGWMTQQHKAETKASDWLVEGHDPEFLYHTWVDQMLGKQYRGWYGFEAARELLPWFVYKDSLPGPVQEWFVNYWTAWLMPDRETSPELFPEDPTTPKLIHPMYDQLKKGSNTSAKIDGDSYWLATKDWRGNKSFYRSGFNYTISTTNFNNSASMGALLGGALIGSERALADGRHGQANFPLKLWTWFDGSTQEEIDDYYFGITVKAQKMIADFGPEPLDRLLGRSQFLKSMTMLVDDYHPGLRRWVTGASRTATHLRLGSQEGLYGILHVYSRKGTYTDLDNPGDLPYGYEKFGHEYPLGEVARQCVSSPFAPLWYSNVIDEKPLPYQVTATFKQWGAHVKYPIMRRTYLAENYGIYTNTAHTGNIPLMAHWRRKNETPTTSHAIGTMLVRSGINNTRWVNDAGGWIKEYGTHGVLHEKNRLIVSASPRNLKNEKDVSSVQCSIALFNDEKPAPTWTIYAGEDKIETLPATTSAGKPVFVHDGVAYMAFIGLPAMDLGRDAEVVIRNGEEQIYYDKYKAKPALVIDNHIIKRDSPLAKDADWEAIDKAYGGFVIEFGDEKEYRSFDAFRQKILAATLKTGFKPDENLHEISYTSGDVTLSEGVFTDRKSNDKPMNELLKYQTVNGEAAYLPAGVERDSPFSVQAYLPRLEKGGAVLETSKDRLAVLQRDPKSGAVMASNPLAEFSLFQVSLPEGIRAQADGGVSLCFLQIEPREKRVTLDYAFTEQQQQDPLAAQAMVLFGLPDGASVIVNGAKADDLQTVMHEGKTGLVIPMTASEIDLSLIRKRLAEPPVLPEPEKTDEEKDDAPKEKK